MNLADSVVGTISCFDLNGEFAGQKIKLAPFQENYVRGLCQDGPGDKRLIKSSTMLVPRKSAKCLALDTPIPTPTGWVEMADLKQGDQIFDDKGEICNVIATSDIKYNLPCYRITFSDGTSIVSDSEHLWTVYDVWRERDFTLSTADIAATYIIGNRPNWKERRYSLPLVSLKLPEADLPIDPYILGVWLGDGTSANACVTVGAQEDELLEHIRDTGTTTCIRRPKNKTAKNK